MRLFCIKKWQGEQNLELAKVCKGDCQMEHLAGNRFAYVWRPKVNGKDR